MTNLINKIDELLLKRETERQRKRESHYPSDISACRRQLYYKWTDEPISDPVDANGLFKFAMGNAVEQWVSDQLAGQFETAPKMRDKKNVEGLKHPFSYEIDNLILINKEICGVEIKSSYGRGIVEIQKSGKPKEEHLLQILCYMQLSGLNKFYLIYYGRDFGYRTQFEIKSYVDAHNEPQLKVNGDDRLDIVIRFQTILERLKIFEKDVEDKKLPDRDFKAYIRDGKIIDKFQRDKVEYRSEWQCSYCSYASQCWKSELNESKKDITKIIGYEEKILEGVKI